MTRKHHTQREGQCGEVVTAFSQGGRHCRALLCGAHVTCKAVCHSKAERDTLKRFTLVQKQLSNSKW